jgi:erythrin-vacuolar iron transport family protein
MKGFSQLTAREILAVAISSEEEDARIYVTFADDLRERYPASAKMIDEADETRRRTVG